jgi:biopolymer transport protein ExbD
MAGATQRKGIIAAINVTPLVDIMLVLLIIFMLTAHLIARQAIEVRLPQASQGATLEAVTLAVTVTREGHLALNGQPVGAEALTAAVRNAVARDPETQVIIAGDRDVSYGHVVWVLDLVKSLGVTSFAIQIDPVASIPPAPGL